MTTIHRRVSYHIYHRLYSERFSVINVDDVCGVETRHMNQSELDRVGLEQQGQKSEPTNTTDIELPKSKPWI